MDPAESLDRVIVACWHDDDSEAERWFDALCDVLAELEPTDGVDLDAVATAMKSAQLPADRVDALIAVLEELDAPSVLAEAADTGAAKLCLRYAGLLAMAQAGEGMNADAGYPEEDPEAWNSFLTQNGPAWNGTEEGWQTFRDWFAYHAAELGVGTSAEAFLAYAENAADMATVFTEYGIAPPAPHTDTDDTDTGTDTAASESAVDDDGFAEGDLAALFDSEEEQDLAQELAALSEEELAELIAEVTAELASTGSSTD